MSLKPVRSLSGKIILILGVACLTIVLAWSITTNSFQKVLVAVRQLSVPDPRMKVVDSLFRQVVELDQLQRLQTYGNGGRSYRPFLEKSESIRVTLDTLRQLNLGREDQLRRIDTMKKLLVEREKLFVRYNKLRERFLINDTLSSQIQYLSDFISSPSFRTADSSAVTAEKRTTTTVRENVDTTIVVPKQTFWDKLLGRRREIQSREITRLIQEELLVKVDTSAIAQEDSVIVALSRAIADLEAGRQLRRDDLVRQRRELDVATGRLVHQLFTLLKELQESERQRIAASNDMATGIIDQALENINIILVGFITLTIVFAVMILTDVARSQRYRAELIAAKEEAEALGMVKQRFLANMSHEIRTPLQSIIGYAEQMKADPGQRNERNVEIVYQSSQHLLHTVNEVLDYSRITSGKLSISSVPFDLRATVERVKEMMDLQATQKGLQFRYNWNIGEEANPMLLGDAFRLKQILINVVGNAIKFTQRGKVTLSVGRRAEEEGAVYRFEITDTGVGIAPEEQERIFKEFEQSSERAVQEGSGLGLSIVKALVEAQEGSIRLHSEPGKGSTFIIELPYRYAEVGAASAEQQEHALIPGSARVWVVDDDQVILDLCSIILQKHGIPFRCFNSPVQVLQEAAEGGADVIFMDIRMPGMSGFELLQRLREQPAVRDGLFIALTAQVLPDEHEEIIRRGFNEILPKPFSEAGLLQAIAKVPVRLHLTQAIPVPEDEMAPIWQSFVTETRKDLGLLKETIERGDREGAPEVFHRMAGRCGQLGLKELAALCREAEYETRAGRWVERAIVDVFEAVQEVTERLSARYN